MSEARARSRAPEIPPVYYIYICRVKWVFLSPISTTPYTNLTEIAYAKAPFLVFFLKKIILAKKTTGHGHRTKHPTALCDHGGDNQWTKG